MRRNYRVMREVLKAVERADGPCGFDDLRAIEPQDDMFREIRRLEDDSLIDGDVEFVGYGSETIWRSGKVGGLTAEGERFYRLIENDEVWKIVSETLGKAGIDVSYPLLREVCEEIVKRYVTSFIPEIG